MGVAHNLRLLVQQTVQVNSTLLIELLQVMSAFYARSALKFKELLTLVLIMLGKGFRSQVAVYICAQIVRWKCHSTVYFIDGSTPCSGSKTAIHGFPIRTSEDGSIPCSGSKTAMVDPTKLAMLKGRWFHPMLRERNGDWFHSTFMERKGRFIRIQVSFNATARMKSCVRNTKLNTHLSCFSHSASCA